MARYGPQQSTDQWRPDCGNGVRPDGTKITGNDPHDTSTEIGPGYVAGWLGHLTGKYGTAASGGVRFYNLDNEPDIWHSTHRDVHPLGASSEEVRNATYSSAGAVKAADPAAKTLGPVGWGWSSWDYSGLDQETCGRTGCWADPPDRAVQRQPAVLRLVPPADEGVRGRPRHPHPRLLRRALLPAGLGGGVRQRHRPAITEYNWGALDSINGALTQADVLGIFGREGLDLATLWSPPSSAQPGAYAFRMFRDYDGAGAAFGETAVRATSADQGRLSVYGAERAADGALTLVVVNKSGADLTAPLTVTGRYADRARVYRYGLTDLATIAHLADEPVTGGSVTGTYPADSITVLELPFAS